MSTPAERNPDHCELCSGTSKLSEFRVEVDPSVTAPHPTQDVVLCDTCLPAVTSGEALEGAHWYCLKESIWSPVPAVQALSYRLLHRLPGQAWAVEQLEQAYLEDDVLAWAKHRVARVRGAEEKVVDSNGVELSDGDSVTLIKDLVVKGANFTAKRGTLVKGIRLGDDPTHIEGRVNRVAIMLKTSFLKRVG